VLFYVNDDRLDDNGGAWHFHTLIYHASAPPG